MWPSRSWSVLNGTARVVGPSRIRRVAADAFCTAEELRSHVTSMSLPRRLTYRDMRPAGTDVSAAAPPRPPDQSRSRTAAPSKTPMHKGTSAYFRFGHQEVNDAGSESGGGSADPGSS